MQLVGSLFWRLTCFLGALLLCIPHAAPAEGELGIYKHASKSILAGFPHLDEVTIDDLKTFFEDGRLTSVELVQVRWRSSGL